MMPPPPSTPSQAMTELEQRLAAPGGEAQRQALLEQLRQLQWRLRQKLAASVPRADYQDLAALALAVEAAHGVLETCPANPANTPT